MSCSHTDLDKTIQKKEHMNPKLNQKNNLEFANKRKETKAFQTE